MKKIELVEIRQVNDALAEMVALFRVELRSYKGIASKPNVEDGREEMKEYLLAGFPVFAATVHGEYAGYVVCRIESEVVWVESIFVREEYRRQGVAAALHGKAEEIAASYGNDTVYNYVHPNNHRMIEFLRKRGYTVRQASRISVVRSASVMVQAFNLWERFSMEAGRRAMPRPFSAIVIAVRASSQVR